VLPLRYRHGDQELSFFSISATVGTATDVTVEELTIEAFYPADAATAAALRSPGSFGHSLPRPPVPGQTSSLPPTIRAAAVPTSHIPDHSSRGT
jgi:hypothetical protein